jgi:quercetin dioxygenase-like cupin family protein
VKKPAGSVTVFAFDEGQGFSEHIAPFDALVQVLEGEAEITIAGKTHHLKGGDLILMPAQVHLNEHGKIAEITRDRQVVALEKLQTTIYVHNAWRT